MSPTILYLWEFRDLPPSQGGEVRCACLSFFVFLFPSSGNMAKELELLCSSKRSQMRRKLVSTLEESVPELQKKGGITV